MNLLLFTLPAAVIPSILLLWYFQSRERYSQQSKKIWSAFGIGLLSTFFVVIIVSPLAFFTYKYNIHNRPMLYGIIGSLFSTAIPEESMKLLVLIKYCKRKKYIETKMDGLVYGTTVSLGYATLENIFYVFFYKDLYTAIIRGLIAVPAHSMLGAIMGYHLAKKIFDKRDRYKQIIIAWIIPIGLHTLYNFPEYLTDGIYYSGSRVWWPMFYFFKAISFSTLWFCYCLIKKYFNDAKEEQQYQIMDEFENDTSK